jgi:hypothetical protein
MRNDKTQDVARARGLSNDLEVVLLRVVHSPFSGRRRLPLLAAGWCLAASAVYCGDAADGRITEVVGLLSSGDTPQVAVKMTGEPSKWLTTGMEYHGNTITDIDLEHDVVKVRSADGAAYTVPLNVAKIGLGPGNVSGSRRAAVRLPSTPPSARTTPSDTVVFEVFPPKGTKVSVDDLDFAWIDSSANPMREVPVNPVGGEMLKWRTMTPDEKAAFVETYRQCGWAITVHDTNKGVGFTGQKLSRPRRK